MRDHEPILIDEFNGLWKRGDAESCPMDHFSDCDNLQYIQSGFKSRNSVQVLTVNQSCLNYQNVKRMYNYVHQEVQSLLVLDDQGNIYHTESPTPCTPILTVVGMTDFAFVNFGGRAYISPHDGAIGLQNEFLYVYLGDGTTARKAAGSGPTGTTFAAANSGTTGHVEAGIHIFAVVYETDTGFLTKLGPVSGATTANDYYRFAQVTAPGAESVNLTNVPVSPDSFVVARHIVATKLIDPTLFTGNLAGYQFYFVPNGKIDDNSTTSITVSFYDEELLDDASHLLDIFEEIAAGVFLSSYHNRLVIGAQYGDPTDIDEYGLVSTAWASTAGEPEAIDSVDGAIVAPLEGNPLTNAVEYRDVLYLFKSARTYAYTDNGDVPAAWPLTVLEQGLGASVHGIALVLDSGGTDVDYLLIINFTGVFLFNGAFIKPELTWKIFDYWLGLGKSNYNLFQILNDSINQVFYIVLNNGKMLYADYSNGLDYKNLRWSPWSVTGMNITTIALINYNQLIIGAL